MNRTKSLILPAAVNFLLFLFLYIAHYCGIFSIKILNANPIVPLALLVAVCMFSGEVTSAFTGLALGIFMDAVSNDSSYLYTVTMFIAALATSLITHYYFNNNIRSALALCVIASIFVFFARWLFFYAFGGNLNESLGYLLRYALPSTLYTVAFVIPFYYLERRLHRHIHITY